MAGRPREFDREQALLQARDLFWERGYEGVSMADLIGAMNISSASIYAAFGSKEALFREAIANYNGHEGGFASRALAEEPTALTAVRRMLRDAVMTFTRPGKPQGCMVVLAATSCAKENEPIAKWLSAFRRARHASILKRLKDACDRGELKPDCEPQTLADFYATLLQGLSVQARDGASKKRMLETVDQAMWLLEAASNTPA